MNEPGSRDMAARADGVTELRCPVKGGGVIAAGTCVDAQEERGCFCPKAFGALAGFEQANKPDAKNTVERLQVMAENRERLVHLRLHAATFKKRPQAEQWAGPAKRAHDEALARVLREPVERITTPAKEATMAPAAKSQPVRTCPNKSNDGRRVCGNRMMATNSKGICGYCQNGTNKGFPSKGRASAAAAPAKISHEPPRAPAPAPKAAPVAPKATPAPTPKPEAATSAVELKKAEVQERSRSEPGENIDVLRGIEVLLPGPRATLVERVRELVQNHEILRRQFGFEAKAAVPLAPTKEALPSFEALPLGYACDLHVWMSKRLSVGSE